jgi:hypothetical protein
MFLVKHLSALLKRDEYEKGSGMPSKSVSVILIFGAKNTASAELNLTGGNRENQK